MLDDAGRGRGGVALISGEAACGKTALADLFAGRAAAAGAVVARAVGARAESSFQLGLGRQLVAALAGQPRARAARVPPPPGSALTFGQPAVSRDGSHAGDTDAMDAGSASFGHELCASLLSLAEQVPVVLVVDDIHYADVVSLQCLLYLTRRLMGVGVLMVFTETAQPLTRHPRLYAELMRQPNSERLWLSPLSPSGVRSVLADRIGEPAAERLATACHRISGGSPLLVHALAHDHVAGANHGALDEGGPAVGVAFAQAVTACLHRCEPGVLLAARAIAVLEEAASTGFVARLAGVDATSAEGAVAVMARTGLVQGLAFRHPATRKAVLDEMADDDRADWYLRAAALLHRHGADLASVARRLITAGRAPEPWCLDVLWKTAQRAAEQDRELAIAGIGLALDNCADPRRRALFTAELARAEWQAGPAAAARHLSTLVPALHEGHLDARDGLAVARFLLWRGDFAEAAQALGRVAELAGEPLADSDIVAELRITREWLGVTIPSVRDSIPEPRLPEPPDRPRHSFQAKAERATLGFAAILRGTAEEDTAHSAEHLLQTADLTDSTLEPVISALLTLVYCGRLTVAGYWCDRFVTRAEDREALTWWALLTAVRAEIAVATGDLVAAESRARAALDRLDRDDWGPAIALPLAGLLTALTMTGQRERADEQVRLDVPAGTFDTRFGLRYLHARGQHYLSSGRLQAALGDFLACGELMVKWGIDTSAIAAWRLGAAEANLLLGRPDRTAELVREQLAVAGRTDPRHTGVALRLLAATSSLRERVRLLRESTQLLESGTDFVELAKTLADLRDTYQSMGAIDKARMLARRAARVGAGRIDPPQPVPASVPEPRVGQAELTEVVASLSEAERRVCALAARGHTNREIGNRLHITVSTVEQHLTKVYRKLNVNTRADLPTAAEFDTADSG